MRLQPRAGADEIVGEREGLLVVRVRAPPERGRANDALCKLIAKRLRIAPGRVELVRGGRSRQKLVRVEGVDIDTARHALGLGGGDAGGGSGRPRVRRD
ncbi:MAG TPA: DUF167 domain-containing protein [Gemmatimonadales bacterium]|nr:DUF167 domain-containing protein [Gemmatimonadales bacterium]